MIPELMKTEIQGFKPEAIGKIVTVKYGYNMVVGILASYHHHDTGTLVTFEHGTNVHIERDLAVEITLHTDSLGR